MSQGTRPSETKARMARALRGSPSNVPVRTEPPAASTPTDAASEPGAKERTRAVRLSVDIEPQRYRWLRVWSANNDLRHMDVLRALLAELESDPELAARVCQRVEQSRG